MSLTPDTRKAFLYRALLLAGLMVMQATLFGHPDLVLQIEELSAAIAADPGNAELLAKRGDLHRRHRDYSAASSDLEAARGADPGYAPLDFLEAELYLDTGRPDRARLRLSRYLAAHPHHGAAWMLRGEAYLGLGQPGPAADDFSKAISVSERPGPELYRLRVLSLAAQGNDHPGAALQAVDEGLKRFPAETSLLGLGVDIALGTDHGDDATRYIQRLPANIRRLSQWQARQDHADCLENAAEPRRQSCLRSAREDLDRQIQSFLSWHRRLP